ncbi:hypothetical protein QF047_000199 [Arthrobacter sp. W4I7]|nr:hypothetical protein [Arthrobacter sp. W4I7]
MVVVEDGIAGLPQGKGGARGEAGPQQEGSGRLRGQLSHGAAEIGTSCAAPGQPEGDGAYQQMQDAAGRKTSPGQQLQGAGIGHILCRVRGLLQFSFDGCSFMPAPKRERCVPRIPPSCHADLVPANQ